MSHPHYTLDVNRGTGRTTRQLEQMKDESAFIWCTGMVGYVKSLCLRIGGTYNQARNVWTKTDGTIVRIFSRELLKPQSVDMIRSYLFREVVLDHAIILTDSELRCWDVVRERVRSDFYFPKRSV